MFINAQTHDFLSIAILRVCRAGLSFSQAFSLSPFFLHHNHYMYWCNIEYLVRISKQYFFGRRKVSNCVLKNWLAQYSNTLIRGCIWLNANQKEAQRERTTTTKPPNSLLQLKKIRYRLSFFADLFLKWSCRESNGLMYAKKIEATASCPVLHIQRSWKQSA